MATPKNTVFGYVFSLMVGTAIIAAPHSTQAADTTTQRVDTVQSTPITSKAQEELAKKAEQDSKRIQRIASQGEAEISALIAEISNKDQELEDLRKTMEIQRKQIKNATLYKQAQDSKAFKNLNVAHLDFELVKKQEDLERQARNLSQQQEWLEKERLRLKKLQKKLETQSDTTAQADIIKAEQRMTAIEQKYKTEQEELKKQNQLMQQRLSEMQNKNAQTRAATSSNTTVATNDKENDARAERKIQAIEKRHAAERTALLAEKDMMEKRLQEIQASHQETLRTAQELKKAAMDMAALKAKHAAERQRMMQDNVQMQQELAKIHSTQSATAQQNKEHANTKEELAKAETQIQLLKEKHQAERTKMMQSNAEMQKNLSALHLAQQEEAAKENSQTVSALAEAQEKMDAAMAKHAAERATLLQENQELQKRLVAQNTLQDRLAETQQKLHALQQRQTAEERESQQALIALKQKEELLKAVQQSEALQAKDKASTLADLEKTQQALEKLQQRHQAEREALLRDNADMQKRLALLQEKQTTTQNISAQTQQMEHELEQAQKTIAALQKRDATTEKSMPDEAALRNLQEKQALIEKLEQEVNTLKSQKNLSTQQLAQDNAALQQRLENMQTTHMAPEPMQTATAKTSTMEKPAIANDIQHIAPMISIKNLDVPAGYPSQPVPAVETQTTPAPTPLPTEQSAHADQGTDKHANAMQNIANIEPAASDNDPYANFLDDIMQVHRGERAPTRLNTPEPSRAIAEEQARQKALENAAPTAQPMAQPTTAVTPTPQGQPYMAPEPTQNGDVVTTIMQQETQQTAPVSAPQHSSVIQEQPITNRVPTQQGRVMQTKAGVQPLSRMIRLAQIPISLIQFDHNNAVQKWHVDFANGLFEQHAWPAQKDASTYDLSGAYLSRYNHDCGNNLKILSHRATGENIRTVYTSCQNGDNTYDAAFVFYGLPQQSFSVFAHVAQPGYTQELQNITEGVTAAVSSIDGQSIYIDGKHDIPQQQAGRHQQAPVNISAPIVE